MPVDSLYRTIRANEFRVVHLLPGKFDDAIRCGLETRQSEVKTRYEALSYQWGDGKACRPIQITRIDYASTPTTTGTRNTSLMIARVINSFKAGFGTQLRILSWALGTGLLWYLVLALPFVVPPWASWLLPRHVYFFLISMVFSAGLLSFLDKFSVLISEISRTKPWLLIYEDCRNRRIVRRQRDSDQSSCFNTLQVSDNLALALRYLRSETRLRTLWVDAICINQENEEEKVLQIQQMDCVYANASTVIVWLGEYHGITEADICIEASSSWLEGGDCKHRHQIQSAFQLVETLTSWRQFIPRCLRTWDTGMLFREGLPGLREMSVRGWWKRLWVMQEVALATGRVRIQCGHCTCYFNDYHSAHARVLGNRFVDTETREEFAPSGSMLAVIKDFGYSSFYDQPKTIIEQFQWKKALFGFILRISKDERFDPFHEQAFPQRLQQVLLRTAGRFHCRNDQDKLYAVLGISGGAKKGTATMQFRFMEYFGTWGGQLMFLNSFSPLLKVLTSWLTQVVLGLAFSSWGIFYQERAKYWTFSRPDFVVDRYKEIIDTVTYGSSGDRRNRVEFFTALARYLAVGNKSPSFLDAANCGGDETMPSWVPNWTREVSETAFDFARRTRKPDEFQSAFDFLEDNKTLVLLGEWKGTVSVARSTNSKDRQATPTFFQAALEKWLVLPNEVQKSMLNLLAIVRDIKRQTPHRMLPEAQKGLIACVFAVLSICHSVGSTLLAQGGTTLIYSFSPSAEQQMGFLKAGDAVIGDELVFVPGCFHYLVLRRLKETSGERVMWRLVGLVSMASQLKHGRVCSKSAWAQLKRDRAVYKFHVQ